MSTNLKQTGRLLFKMHKNLHSEKKHYSFFQIFFNTLALNYIKIVIIPYPPKVSGQIYKNKFHKYKLVFNSFNNKTQL